MGAAAMKFEQYFHQNAKTRIPATILSEVDNALLGIGLPDGPLTTTQVVSSIRKALAKVGWSDEVFLSNESKNTISGMKGAVGLAIQFGNISRIYADYLKLQSLFLDAKLKSAVIIVPAWSFLRDLSRTGGTDNRCNLDRIKRELPIFSLVINMPLAVYGVSRN